MDNLCRPRYWWWSTTDIRIPLGVSVILLVLWKLKGEWTGAEGDKFDLTGSIIYGVAIVTVMYGITIIPALLSIWLILTGIVALAAFVKYETKTSFPVFEVTLFIENRAFSFSCLAALINYSATLIFALFIGRTQITPTHYPVFIHSVKIAFIVFSCLCVTGIYFSLSRGQVRDR